MRYSEFLPPPSLADSIRCFWFLSGNPGERAEQPVVADGRLEIVLHLAAPFEVRGEDACWRPQEHALLAGQLTAPLSIRPVGETDVVGIRFRTAGAAAFLAVPPAELNNRVVPLADLVPALRHALIDTLHRATRPSDRVTAMAHVLSRYRRSNPDALAQLMVQHLDHPRAPAISTVADQLRLSVRTVERRVKEATGLAPVELRAVMRFRRCYRLLETVPIGWWGRVALSSGYYDQAHCIREFRRFTSASPTEWFGQEPELAAAFLTGETPRLSREM